MIFLLLPTHLGYISNNFTAQRQERQPASGVHLELRRFFPLRTIMPAIQKSSILRLPDEIIHLILSYSHPIDIVIFRKVCKRILRIIDGSILCQLRIYLIRHGMELNRVGAPVSVLRKIATNLYNSHNLLDPVNRWHIELGEGEPESYDICEGVFARGLHRASPDTFRGAAFTSLTPERWKETEVEQRIFEDFNMEIKIFFFHPSQDLLVLMERPSSASARVHFREFSSLGGHPLATKEFIEITNPYGEVWEECLIEVRDNILVGYFFNYTESVNRGMACGWDWKTGEVLMNVIGVTGLALLSNDQALVIFDGKAHEDNGNEPAENENKDAKGCPWKTPCLGIFTFSTAKMTNYLQLPIKKSLFEAQIFSSASIGSRSTTAHAAHFVPDEAQNIITLQFLLTLDIARDRAVGFSVVIAVQPLLDRIEALLKIDPDKRGISWTEWGPDTTRWIPNHALRIASFRATYGCRLITFLRWNIIRKAPPVVISDDGEGPSTGDYIGWGRHLAVLDFGKYAVSNQVKAETPESCIVGDVTEPWSYSGEWSSEVVESRLPFRVHTKYLGNFMEAYLDGSSIVGREEHRYIILSFWPMYKEKEEVEEKETEQ